MKNYINLSRKAIIIGLCGATIAATSFAMPKAHQGEEKLRIGIHAQLERAYTIPELTILVEANLLRQPNTSLTLDGISKTKEGSFLVELTDKAANKTLEIELNKYGFAVEGPTHGLFDNKQRREGDKKGQRMAQNTKSENGKGKSKSMQPEKKPMKELTLEEATILVKARLLAPELDVLKLGEINKTDTGFDVTILSQDDSLVKRINLNSAGLPKRDTPKS